MKTTYIDLMEKCLEAYTDERIARYISEVRSGGLKEHGFARLASNMGILIANGRKKKLIPIFTEIMDICCESIPTVKAANDFTVKEIIFCIMALEERGILSDKTKYWRECLARVTPELTYNVFAKQPTDKLHNWACFTMLSEYMRDYIGLADTKEFVDIQIASQLQFIDENGMYRDPNEPTVYDLVPRGLFSVLLHFGYRGRYYSEINRILKKSGALTLQMQSVSGEIPYGGRSNQFVHNEAHLAIVLEYEAKRYASMGDMQTAGRFKLGVKKAIKNIEFWLTQQPVRHIKNRFATETSFGCEDYAYFDKYMITAASFLYAACLICDDSIPAAKSEDKTPYTAITSEHFHKLFMRARGYFAELDTRADSHYDACGLGRVHKRGAPSAICLSLPGTSTPNFTVGEEKGSDFSICVGLETDEGTVFATDKSANYRVIDRGADQNSAFCTLECELVGKVIRSEYKLSSGGVSVKASAEGKVAVMLPAFSFDGAVSSKITADKNRLDIEYLGWVCRYTVKGKLYDTERIGYNRNGIYRLFAASADSELNVKIRIFRKKKI